MGRLVQYLGSLDKFPKGNKYLGKGFYTKYLMTSKYTKSGTKLKIFAHPLSPTQESGSYLFTFFTKEISF